MEIEMKYAGGAQHPQDLFAHPLLAPWLGPCRTIPMEAVYYDTPGGDCARAGFALRLRREGEACICTAKGGGIHNGLARRVEIEVPATTLEEGVAALAAHPELPGAWAPWLGQPLEPRARMCFTRKAADYHRGALSLELCYDWGEITAGAGRAPIDEWELELKAGSEDAFLALNRALQQDLGWQPWEVSKYARAKALLAGEGQP